jgi:hypothetical protein
VEGSNASRQAAQFPNPVKVAGLTIPAREKILQAFQELGTVTAVARFFGVSRRTIDRWTRRLNLQPELRPEVPISRQMRDLLSEPVARIKVAQWIADEGSISVAYDCRSDSTSLLVAGAMNDNAAVEAIAQVVAVRVAPGPVPISGRLPMHPHQGSRAESIRPSSRAERASDWIESVGSKSGPWLLSVLGSCQGETND